jgi:hypothetical protein
MDRFTWGAEDLIMPQCASCVHKRIGPGCDAYPNQIPTPILRGEHDHRAPYPGDNGIQFEPIESPPDE